jgi:hypothetical protein
MCATLYIILYLCMCVCVCVCVCVRRDTRTGRFRRENRRRGGQNSIRATARSGEEGCVGVGIMHVRAATFRSGDRTGKTP